MPGSGASGASGASKHAWVGRLGRLGKGAATFADKLAAQKEQRDLEGQRDKKRRELFDRHDEIQHKRDGLIDELERQLKQEITVSTVLTCEWELT